MCQAAPAAAFVEQIGFGISFCLYLSYLIRSTFFGYAFSILHISNGNFYMFLSAVFLLFSSLLNLIQVELLKGANATRWQLVRSIAMSLSVYLSHCPLYPQSPSLSLPLSFSLSHTLCVSDSEMWACLSLGCLSSQPCVGFSVCLLRLIVCVCVCARLMTANPIKSFICYVYEQLAHCPYSPWCVIQRNETNKATVSIYTAQKIDIS